MPEIKKGTTLVPAGKSSQETGVSKRPSQTNEVDLNLLTLQDLNSILEVNQKALTIYLEVERQNQQILEVLQESSEKLEHLEKIEDDIKDFRRDMEDNDKSVKDNAETLKEMKKKIEDLDKNMFRLVLILGSAGIGTIITIIQAFLTHK